MKKLTQTILDNIISMPNTYNDSHLFFVLHMQPLEYR
jgi:hypothetical protein